LLARGVRTPFVQRAQRAAVLLRAAMITLANGDTGPGELIATVGPD
jgi:hypothetical protein